MSEDHFFEKSKLSEPEVSYGNMNRMIAFTSFEEENEAQYQHWKSMTPEQRLEEHRKLSLIVFADMRKYDSNRLIFD
jgi:hypothetical protein